MAPGPIQSPITAKTPSSHPSRWHSNRHAFRPRSCPEAASRNLWGAPASGSRHGPRAGVTSGDTVREAPPPPPPRCIRLDSAPPGVHLGHVTAARCPGGSGTERLMAPRPGPCGAQMDRPRVPRSSHSSPCLRRRRAGPESATSRHSAATFLQNTFRGRLRSKNSAPRAARRRRRRRREGFCRSN